MSTYTKVLLIIFILFLITTSVSSKENLSNIILVNTHTIKEQIVDITNDDVLIKRISITPINNELNNNLILSNFKPLSTCYGINAATASGTQSYVINPVNSIGIDENTFNSVISTSAETWDNETTQEIFNNYTIDKSATASVYDVYPDAKNTIIIGSLGIYSLETLALTQTWYYKSNNKIFHFDIIFNEDLYFGDASVNPQLYDLQSIATHEFGHSIGLDDLYTESCNQETMYGYEGKGDTFARTLNDGDIAGLNVIYPSEKRVLTKIMVTPAIASVISGYNQTFNITSKDQFGKPISSTVIWGSSNTSVGTITSSGLFRALKAGTTTITAASGSVSGYANVTVIPGALASIIVLPSSVSIMAGQTQNFTAYGYDANSNDVSTIPEWSSSNTTIGTIIQEGLFTALANGTTTVIAKAGSVVGSATVVVRPISKGVVTRSLSSTIVTPDGIVTVTITPDANLPSGAYYTYETIPEGFTFVNTTAFGSSNVGNVYTLKQPGATPFTYVLRAPAVNGTYTINGTFRDIDREIGTVTGSSTVRVVVNLLDSYLSPGATPAMWKAGVIKAMDDYFDNGALTKADLLSVMDAYFA